MSRRTLIILFVAIIISAVGFGVHFISNHLEVASKKIKIIEVPPEEAKKYIRLIYESKGGETGSESLYNIDKLDGKVDEPHIVVRYPKIQEVFHMDSKVEIAKELELIFIGKGDKALKTVKYVNTPYMGKMNVWFSKNRKIAIVLQMRRDGAYWYAYDQEGNLLWEQEGAGMENSLYPYYFSPDGEYIVMTDGYNMASFPDDISKETGNQVVIFDKHLKTKIAHKIEGYKHFGGVTYSPLGNYFVVGGIRKEGNKIDRFIFNRNGNLISKFKIGEGYIKGVSDDGYIFMEWETEPKTFAYSFNGKKIWHENRGMKLLTDGKRFYYQWSSSSPHGEIIIDAITRKEVLFIDGEESGFRFINLFFPLAYSKGKPVLFQLKAQKLVQNGQAEVDLGEVYLLIKDNTGLLIKFQDIFPEDVRGVYYSFCLVNGKLWGDKDTRALSSSPEENPYSGSNCVEVILGE